MKKLHFFMFIKLLLIYFIFLSGCAIDPHYTAEKLFWYAEQNAKKITFEKKGILNETDWNNIISYYRKVIKFSPLDKLSLKSKAVIIKIYLAQNKYDEIHVELKEIIENFSVDPGISTKAFFTSGKIYELEKKFDDAFLEYEKIKDLYPLSNIGLNIPLYLLKFCKEHKDKIQYNWTYDETKRHYLQLVNEYSKTSYEIPLKNYLLQLYFQEEKWEEVIDFWSETSKRENVETPLIMQASLAQADVYSQKLDQKDKAVEILKELYSKYPDHEFIKHIKFRLAYLYKTMNDLSKSKELFENIIKENSDSEDFIIQCKLQLISIMKKDKDNEKVISAYDELTKQYPNNLQILPIPFSKYLFYKNNSNEDAASVVLKSAITIYQDIWNKGENDKKSLISGQLLLFCYYQLDDNIKSIEILDSLSKRFPETPQFLFAKAALYKNKLKDLKKAKEIFNEIQQKYPNSFSLNNSLKALMADNKNTMEEIDLSDTKG